MPDGTLPEIISRAEAIARGLKRYFTGKPCKRGHIAERYVGHGQCIECCRERGAQPCSLSAVRDYYRRNAEKYATHARNQRARDPEKHREYKRAWHVKNREKICEAKRAWRAKYREKRREYARKYRALNIAKFRERDRERHRKNPGRWLLQEKRLAQATPPWVDREELAEFWKKRPSGYHVDHIVPIKGITAEGYLVSGLNVPWNLQYLHASENLAKSNRLHHVGKTGLALPSIYVPRQPLLTNLEFTR